MLNDLLLLSKNDIPFTEAKLVVHQPSIKQIGYIGEESFFIGCQFLNLSKESLTSEDKNRLGEATNFDILMSIIKEPNPVVQKNKACAEMVLLLMFPDYRVSFAPNSIMLIKQTDKGVSVSQITKENFDAFQSILSQMFCLKSLFKSSTDYNPGDKKAERLAQQFRKYHEKLAQMKKQGGEGQKVAILTRYISILAVGEKKDMNSLLGYSVYQLFDEFQRFCLKQESDIYVQAKMAGAKDLKEVENWMKDIHSDSE